MVTHETQEEADHVHPLSVWQLHGGDGRYDLGSEGADLCGGGAERHESILLDLVLGVIVKGEPAVGVVGLPRDFLGTKERRMWRVDEESHIETYSCR